jgi:hypothetical protein
MRNKMRFLIFAAGLVIGLILNANAQMQSPNYRIPSAVLSGGGAPMRATSFQINATIGQPSPLQDPADPTFSDTYDLYPGFWYTIVTFGLTCPGDFDSDGDVDGKDLAEYIFDSGGLGLNVFAINFGRANCP